MRLAPVLATTLAFAACDCGQSSDEELLREKIDTTPVHLYVAAKVALTKADDPAVGDARGKFLAVLGALRAGDAGGAADTASNAASVADLLVLGRAVWELRETGAAIVRDESEDDLEPLLPVLLRMGNDDANAARINRSTDHALFFLGLWALKVHPRSPTPIPDEILLYEGSRIDPDELAFPALKIPVYGLRSYVYATNELCDLAERDARSLEDISDREALLRDVFVGVGGAQLSTSQSEAGVAGIRALSHGSTAYCFFGRDEAEKAREELEHFVVAAEEAGASPADIALVRAYLAYAADELPEARAQLELAKTADWMTDTRREEIDELIDHLDRDDTGFVDRYFDKAFFARFVGELVLREASDAGLFDSVKETAVYQSVSRYLQVVGGVLGSGSDRVSEAAEATKERAGALWRRIRGRGSEDTATEDTATEDTATEDTAAEDTAAEDTAAERATD
ncbi:MAG: hypothetical protein AAGE52_17130 [Myxococcota bacterium]